ncbi:hypothetical protein CJ030_MR7G011612 [Morella rubra]|uniref:Uncharacterized protein n=1 Tax=Morella rubra TaxID=262757 RepID=A0A6A1V3T4_9ROSI|nr:hypothetical protein CJ030_MR7G011612 [Morella rubra]
MEGWLGSRWLRCTRTWSSHGCDLLCRGFDAVHQWFGTRENRVEFLARVFLPDSIKGIKVFFEIATYKLPWIPNFIYKDYLEAMFEYRRERAELLKALVIDDKNFNPAHYPQHSEILVPPSSYSRCIWASTID